MAYRCPLCGGQLAEGETCRDRYDRMLAVEFSDPAYFAVHHLSVPAYLLQHNEYSREGWLWAREGLAAAIRHHVAPAELRRQQRTLVESGNRDWRVRDGPRPEWFSDIAWTRTIADVQFGTADAYVVGVRAWAAAVLADTDDVVSRIGGRPDPVIRPNR